MVPLNETTTRKTGVASSHRKSSRSPTRQYLSKRREHFDVMMAADILGIGSSNVAGQQLILTVWHDLYRSRIISWGFDFQNREGTGFFHLTGRGKTAMVCRLLAVILRIRQDIWQI